MGKYIKRKQLTPEQYKMANKTMAIIMTVCYITYIVTEISNMTSGNGAPFWQFRCGIYVVLGIVGLVLSKKKGTEKKTMLFYSITFLIAYLLLVMNNGIATMSLAFPALIGFMLYLNSLLVGTGCILALLSKNRAFSKIQQRVFHPRYRFCQYSLFFT